MTESTTKSKKPFRTLRFLWGLVRLLLRVGALLGGGWLLYSRFMVPRKLALSHALGGERRATTIGELTVSYYVSGTGKPLLLLHDLGIAASAYDVKPLYDHFSASRQTLAIDWPGFGFSDRLDVAYSSRMYVDLLHEFIENVIGSPVDVIAVGTSAEFAAQAAREVPEMFRSLSLLAPSSLGSPLDRLHLDSDLLLTLMQAPLWKRPLYDFLTTYRALRWQLSQQFALRQPDAAMINYAYVISHQPGAHHAPMYYLSGKLASPNMTAVYDQLNLPVMVITGSGFIKGWDALRGYEDRANWHAERLTGVRGAPHLERPEEVTTVLSAFLKDYALPESTE